MTSQLVENKPPQRKDLITNYKMSDENFIVSLIKYKAELEYLVPEDYRYKLWGIASKEEFLFEQYKKLKELITIFN